VEMRFENMNWKDCILIFFITIGVMLLLPVGIAWLCYFIGLDNSLTIMISIGSMLCAGLVLLSLVIDDEMRTL